MTKTTTNRKLPIPNRGGRSGDAAVEFKSDVTASILSFQPMVSGETVIHPSSLVSPFDLHIWARVAFGEVAETIRCIELLWGSRTFN